MLSQNDGQLLHDLAKSCKDPKEKVRYLALHAIAKGHAITLVSEIFCVDEATVYRWIERWQEEKNLSDKSREGRPPELTEKDKGHIKKLVEENNPKKQGINSGMWDCKELQKYFLMRGKNISQETIRKCLIRYGAHYVKAEIEYAEADLKAQEEFAKQFFKDMKSKPTSVVVLFQDESSVSCSPKKGYGWTFEERLIIKVPQKGGRKRLNCFGAVNPFKGELVQIATKESKAPAFIRLLDKIRRKYNGRKIWIYLDNYKVHKSEEVEKYLRKHPKIELRFLPPYSPDLNLQEQWWNFQRRKLLNTKCFSSRHQLATSINWFVRRTPSVQIRSICSFAPIANLVR